MSALAAAPSSAPVPTRPDALVSAGARLMGGRVAVHLRPEAGAAGLAERDAARVLRRIGAWADRLSRFAPASDLSRLNADPRAAVPVRPTLATVLDWGRAAEAFTDGVVDVALLDARLAAEGIAAAVPVAASRTWSLDRRSRGAVVRRPTGLGIDLDGVAKGWIADRALGLLGRHPAAVVDADGDVAVRLAPGERWSIGVADPRDAALDVAVFELACPDGRMAARFGLATSGTSVHRWVHDGDVRHHLIDSRTGRPARTDVVQATVLAGSAREAEAWAKTTVILGSQEALRTLDRPGVAGALILTERDELLALPSTLRWLA